MATGTLHPAPTGRETKAERTSREAQDAKYLDGLFAERDQMLTVVKAEGAGAAKAAKRQLQIEVEIKRCGGQVPSGRGRAPSGTGADD